MAPVRGSRGPFRDPVMIFAACTEVSIFLIDAYELRTKISRLRITITPEPATVAHSTNIYSIHRVEGTDGEFGLFYNCRHDQLTDVDDCTGCDKGTVLHNWTQIDRIMFDDEVLAAMKWLSSTLNAIDAKGYVQMEPSISRSVDWWNEHIDLKPPVDPNVRSPFFGANRVPIPWSIWCAHAYGYPMPDNLPGTRSNEDEDVQMSNATPAQLASQATAGASEAGPSRPPARPLLTEVENREGVRELYWDPVYDSHDQNVEPDFSNWPDLDELPIIPDFPFRHW